MYKAAISPDEFILKYILSGNSLVVASATFIGHADKKIRDKDSIPLTLANAVPIMH